MQGKKKDILKAIQKKREVMIISAKETGFTSSETIKHSQELDELINQYQLATRQSKQKQMIVTNSHKKSMIIWPNNLVY